MSTSDHDPRTGHELPPAPPEPTGYAAPQHANYVRPPMPREVNWATILMVVSIVLSIIGTIVVLSDKSGFIKQIRDNKPDYSQKKLDDTYNVVRVTAIVTVIIIAVLYVWLIVKIRQGRNWARIVATVLLALGILSSLSGLAGTGTGASKALQVIGLIISIAVLVLLWLRPSNAYFKERPPA